MKRHHPLLHPNTFSGSSGTSPLNNPGVYSTGKSKMWENTEQDAGVDELLAVLGYKVRSSDMVQVAQKIKHLEKTMGEDEISQLGSNTVHYNPSDLSSWLGSMITELDPPAAANDLFLSPAEPWNNMIVFDDSSPCDYDLKVIPGKAVYPPSIEESPVSPINKKQKTIASDLKQKTESVVLVDSQENGIRLVHTLLACAEAVQQNNQKLAEALVKQVGFLAVSQIGAMRKVATYFAEALARRIYKLYPQDSNSFSVMLEMQFYETCPYLKFAHFTANQAILEAFSNKKRVHVIDFSVKQGVQWPALMQALAVRPGGPPSFRLTGIGPPSNDNTDYLQEVGWKLAQMAETFHVEFEYRGFVANSLADLDATMLDIREGETVAVNSVFEFHQLLARTGGIEKVLAAVIQMKPHILTVVEQEANHNGPVFLDRFTDSLHYYSSLFDSVESGCNGDMDGDEAATNQQKVMSEVYLGRQICNLVACEGVDRVERHENLTQWRTRLGSAGFEPVHLGSNAFKQASMLLELYAGGRGYRVVENEGCLMLGWHTRPLITTSAWKLSG